MANLFCEKCKKTMDEDNFYTYKDGSKTELCKKCLTMHIDNYNPDTYLWLLEKMDVPYLPVEWNVLRDRAYAKDPYKMNGMSVFGKYLSKMKLKQWKNYGWADTERLQAEQAEQEKAYMLEHPEANEKDKKIREMFEQGLISETQYKTYVGSEVQVANNPPIPPAPKGVQVPTGFGNSPYPVNNPFEVIEMADPAADLTQEDKVYLAMKWGKLYKPDEWIALEKNYNEMMESFDIQDADTINTLILLCKINLKMNQAIDCGDMEGALKSSRMYDSLRKSAKFTAAQNKEDKNNFIDSIGEMVLLCEREEGFIPRFPTDIPQDKVDLTLKDMNNYVKKLVTQDLGFGQQIEDAIKKIQIQKEMNEAEDNELLEDDEITSELLDQDLENFYQDVADQKAQDYETLKREE